MDTSATTNAWRNNDVSNATFGGGADASNFWRHGTILYIGYRSAFQEEDARAGYPHAKRLRLVALDLHTKRVIWQETFTFAVEGMTVYTGTMSRLIAVDNTVYLYTVMYNGAGGSWLTALDASTGRHLWSHTDLYPAAMPDMVVCQGRVFLRADQLYVLDGATGTTLWRYPLHGKNFGQAVSVVHETVFVLETSSGSGSRSPQPERACFVRALRLGDGAERWATSLGPVRTLPVIWTPFATHDAVYAVYSGSGSGSTVVYALDTRAGTIRWMSPPGPYIGRPVLADDQFLYLYGGDGGTVLDAASGAPLWSRGVYGCTFPIVLPDHGFYGMSAGGYLYAYRGTDGECLWYTTREMLHVTVDDTYLYGVGIDQVGLYRVDRKTGAEERFLQIEPSEKPAWQQEQFLLIAVR